MFAPKEEDAPPPQDPATRGHLIEGDEHRQHCKRCGRITIAKDKRKFWNDHWCEILPTYAKGLEKGHTLEVGSDTEDICRTAARRR